MSIFFNAILPMNELKIGDSGKIVKINTNSNKMLRRLLELGLTKDTVVKIINYSFLKKVVLFSIRGYVLSLRVLLAKDILVEKI